MLKRFITMILAAVTTISAIAQNNSALLFYLSATDGATADYAAGQSTPTFLSLVSSIDDGACGKALHCADKMDLAYKAAGNIYAKKGTMSFFWRSGQPLYETEFPIFRVSFADHSSWDMTWMRIDYNGHGFDAFVTDNHLARVRVHTKIEVPENDWIHIALSWDENSGIRFYLNGELAASKDSVTVLDTGLDQFGPHQRIISPYKVQSAYNMQRGGDIDELRIYSEVLSDSDIASLSRGVIPEISSTPTSITDPQTRQEWDRYYGFDSEPPYLTAANTTVRKIGILEAYDLKRWWWKATDGILETTWPGVYNRSRLPGRNDYFQLPDWDCYRESGWKVRFNMPDEQWNYVEVTGGAYGTLGVSSNSDGSASKTFSRREKGQHRTFHMMESPVTGNTLTFENEMQEEPIQELNAYYVHEGTAPQGIARLEYTLAPFENYMDQELMEVEEYIAGRFEEDARQTVLAAPSTNGAGTAKLVVSEKKMLPIVHIVIPADTRDLSRHIPLEIGGRRVASFRNQTWNSIRGGLDGILIEIPAMDIKATNGNLIPINIQVKDPVWKLRNMLDVSFSVKRGETRTVWFDMRDRILPEDKPIYMTVASTGGEFNAESLAGMKITLIFKPMEEAKTEHVADRLTQVRDTYAMTCEENTASLKYPKFQQLTGDMKDLFRVDPDNRIGRAYWGLFYGEQVAQDYDEPAVPEGVPEWAFMQLRLMSKYRELENYYIDRRQIENGEFGGGISDDTDFTNTFPAFYHMGLQPEKTRESVQKLSDASYEQGMLTNGVSTIQTDGLHTYEEGVNALDQTNIIDMGNPRLAERLMETARSLRDILYGVNEAGHTHMRSDYFSATKIADKGLWVWSTNRSYFHTAPALLMGELYGNKGARESVMKFIDSMYEHSRLNARGQREMPEDVNFLTDEVRSWGFNNSMPPLWYAYLWTGNEKYLGPVNDSGWIGSVGDKNAQAASYRRILRDLCNREYVMTEGSIWIDRVNFPPDVVQTARLGAPAMNRLSHYVPSNAISWKFEKDESAETVAIWVSRHSNTELEINFWNTESKPVKARMTGVEALIGDWELTLGNGKTQTVRFGRSRSIDLTIPSRTDYTIRLRLVSDKTDFSEYTDLAIGKEDVIVDGQDVRVTLHNISGQDAKPMNIALLNAKGKTLCTVESPVIPAPNDLLPKRAEVTLRLPDGVRAEGCRVVIDPGNEVEELFETNNAVAL